jgi:hypothetical protein
MGEIRIKEFCRKPETKRQLEKARHRRDFNIKIDLNESDGFDSSGSEDG